MMAKIEQEVHEEGERQESRALTRVRAGVPGGMLRLVAPVASIMEAHRELRGYIRDGLSEGSDYGSIPGTDKNKKTLLKPGAEKINAAFGVVPQFRWTEEIDHDRPVEWQKMRWEWGEKQGEKIWHVAESGVSLGLYRYVVICELHKDGVMVGQGVGSCSSMEKKYVDRPREVENTVLKIAKKRAFIDATLSTFGLSDEFNQDLEDEDQDEEEATKTRGQAGRDRAARNVSGQARDAANKLSEINERKALRKQLQDLIAQGGIEYKEAVAIGHETLKGHGGYAIDSQGAPDLDMLSVPHLKLLVDRFAGRLGVGDGGGESDPPAAAPEVVVRAGVGKSASLHVVDTTARDQTCIGCGSHFGGVKDVAAVGDLSRYCSKAIAAIRAYPGDRIPAALREALLTSTS